MNPNDRVVILTLTEEDINNTNLEIGSIGTVVNYTEETRSVIVRFDSISFKDSMTQYMYNKGLLAGYLMLTSQLQVL